MNKQDLPGFRHCRIVRGNQLRLAQRRPRTDILLCAPEIFRHFIGKEKNRRLQHRQFCSSPLSQRSLTAPIPSRTDAVVMHIDRIVGTIIAGCTVFRRQLLIGGTEPDPLLLHRVFRTPHVAGKKSAQDRAGIIRGLRKTSIVVIRIGKRGTPDLLQTADTGDLLRLLPCTIQRGKKNCRKNCNNCNYNKQFNYRKFHLRFHFPFPSFLRQSFHPFCISE